jgi:hypothetical protein
LRAFKGHFELVQEHNEIVEVPLLPQIAAMKWDAADRALLVD